MIYMNRRKRLLSPHLSGYVRASTDNPTGWRPQYMRLGAFTPLPDWKTVAAARDAAGRHHALMVAGQQRQAMARNAMVDAHARGDRSRVHMAGLGALGLVDLNAGMSYGATYTFHFSAPGSGLLNSLAPTGEMTSKVAADSNFVNPTVLTESTGIKVVFTYNGQGSSVMQAGAEMQSVLNNTSFFNPLSQTGQVTFSWAEGGSGSGGYSADGNNPNNSNNQAPFDWSSLFSGIGIGGAAVLALGAVLLLRG